MKAMQQKTTKFESYGLFIQFVQNLKLLYISFDIICKNVRSSQMFSFDIVKFPWIAGFDINSL